MLLAALAVFITPGLNRATADPIPKSPDNFIYDGPLNELVGTYSGPNFPGSSDWIIGSPSGLLIPSAEIVNIYWGAYWTSPAGVVNRSRMHQDIQRLVAGPYFSALPQYGIKSIVLDQNDILNNTPTEYHTDAQFPIYPGNSFDETDVQNVVASVANSVTPATGYKLVFMVLAPPGTVFQSQYFGLDTIEPPGGGEHWTNTINGTSRNVAWIALPEGDEWAYVHLVGHEVAESVTDPWWLLASTTTRNWNMDREYGDGNEEIADAGETVTDTIGGLSENPYWSQNDKACIIPAGPPDAVAGNALTSYYDGSQTHVFYVTVDGHIHELARIPSGSWTHRDITGTGTPALGGSALNSFYQSSFGQGIVNYIGTDKHVHSKYTVNGTWGDIDLTATAQSGAPAAATSLASIRALGGFFNTQDNTPHVFSIDNTGALREFKGIPVAGWYTNVLTGTVGAVDAPASDLSPPALGGSAPVVVAPNTTTQLCAQFDAANTQHVVYFDTSNHVREVYWNGNSPGTVDWTSQFNANLHPAGRDAITTIADPPTSVGTLNHIFYIDTSDHIQHLWRIGASYASEDLTAITSDPQLAGAPALTCATDSLGKIHVFYIGRDNRVHEYVRSVWQAFTRPVGNTAVATYVDTWQTDNAGLASGGLPTQFSRLLTSCYIPSGGQVFDLSSTAQEPYGYVNEQWNVGSGWQSFLPSYVANGPVAFP